MRFLLTIVWFLHLFQCIQPLHLADYSTALTSLERATFIALQLTQSTEVNSLNSAQLKELSIGFLSGAASRALKEIVLHPIDTVKTRLQSPLGKKSRRLFESVYDGLIPSLIGGVPATATFFAVKDFCKRMLKDSLGDTLTKSEVTILAVIVANFPYWIIRTPFEVQKTVEQTSDLNRSNQIQTIEGIKSSYRSYFSNILYSLPADILKFVCYEQINEVMFSQSDVIEGANAAVSGALASAVAQLITTPLDVVRIRIMVDANQTAGIGSNPFRVLSAILSEEGASSLFLGVNARVIRALLSGAVQFASYEFTKNFLKNGF